MDKSLLLSPVGSSSNSEKPSEATESSIYFATLKDGLNKAYDLATQARKKGLDPVNEVEVKIAKDIAARVEGIVGPPGIAILIRELEKEGMERENIAFEIARKIAKGEVIKGDKEQLIEQAVRSGLGILTEGVLVAPTEGIAKVRIKNNPDGSNFVAVYYSGPIRSAGGTAVALSLVLADIARKICGVGDYRPTDTQIMRFNEEIHVYETRCVHLQYLPSEEDIKTIVSHCPICVDGEPTEDVEVSAYRDVPGVETNRVRGGVPLVICDGIALKASKLFKYTKKLKLNWDFLEKIIKTKKKEDKVEIKPDPTYLEGLVAGRPVFCNASMKGGFRLRYGKSRTNGLMAKNIHPATMVLLGEFPAFGTHFKIERPGKGCVISANEDLEPPVVKLKSGRVLKVTSLEEAYGLKNEISEVLFLGDILCTFGDFLKSNHLLLPGGYCQEWWAEELKAKDLILPSFENAEDAFKFSKFHSVPLHPDYTYYWHDINNDQLSALVESLKSAKIDPENSKIRQLAIKNEPAVKRALEDLLMPHRVVVDEIVLETEEAHTLLYSLGGILDLGKNETNSNNSSNQSNSNFHSKIDFSEFDKVFTIEKETKKPLQIINNFHIIKAKAPTYIGARMGRPEKAKERKMDGSPHVLFPTGSFKNRSLTKQIRLLNNSDKESTINLELIRMRCQNCKQVTFLSHCHVCGGVAIEEKVCQKCGSITKFETHCDVKTVSYDRRPIDLLTVYEQAKELVDADVADLKGVKGLSNPSRVPERLEKGFLRAKHDVYVFRDGTSRFDATDVPLTHFKPNEIGLSLTKLKELGYEKDYLGNRVVSGEQLVPLKHQDLLISENGAEYFMRLTHFIDDLLMNVYQLPPFYNIRTKEDLIGHLGVGLSPHTSAGALCRIIGFTKAFVGYAHPYFHTVKRRNCDGDEDCIMLLMDALLNFSRKYLDEKRGGTMDAPLVLSIEVNPKEVDDEAHNIEFVTHYPLEFYQAAEKFASPGEIKLKTVKDVLGTEAQFDLPLTNIGGTLDKGVTRTKYVQLDSIPDKIETQFALQDRLRAVDKKDAAERLILSHFIPDLYGNLRSYSRQTFRCVGCNDIYRRPPLSGKCRKCGGNLLLTINKGGIEKYLEIAREIVRKYDLPIYLRQRLELIDKEIKSIFEDDKIKQLGLKDFL